MKPEEKVKPRENLLNPSGKLKDKRTYLAGAMENVSQATATEWRDKVSLELKKLGVKIFNPCKSKEEKIETERDRITALKKGRRFEALCEKMKKIVRQDLRCIDIVDFVIVYLPPETRSTGTIHELILADTERKPTLLMCEDLTQVPDWIFGILPLRYMFESFEALIDYLKLVDEGYIEDDRRWQFLEFE